MATRHIVYYTLLGAAILMCGAWWYMKMKRDEETRRIAARKAAERARRQREYLMQRYRHDILQKARMESLRNPPIIRKLASILQEFENDIDAWHLLIEVGEIYMRGDFPTYLPNTQLAQDLFRIALTCPRGAVSGIAQSRYIESRESRMDVSDMAGAALPDTYGQRMVRIATHRIRNVSPNAFETPVPMYTPEPRPARIAHEPVVVPIEIPVDRIVHNDLQNVHDHSVTHATRHILENIEKNDKNDRNSRPEIESALLDSALNDDDKIKALAVLDSLTTKTHHTSFKMTETDALNAVWSKIQGMDESMKSNVTETLLHQLASGVENGHVVCSTGKIARFVSALDGLGNDKVKLRPMWAVRDELGTMASKKRGLDGEYSEDRLQELRREFVDEATALYCTDLGLKPSIMEPLISMYADGI
jgi:hypothetical protein